MSFSFPIDYENGRSTAVFNNKPDTCPLCKKGIDARFISAYSEEDALYNASAVCQCPISNCHGFFIGLYEHSGEEYTLRRVYPHYTEKRIFSDEIMNVSKSFVEIFNESHQAEQEDLKQICGTGYRKAFEFLIKDYAIQLAKDDETQEEIKKAWLGEVIRKHIPNPQIQDLAHRAAWLGNDEAHYVRKLNEFDLTHLKEFIELTVRWIEMEEKTEAMIKMMPD